MQVLWTTPSKYPLSITGEKRFQTIQDLVADGLITMYIDTYAKDYVDSMMIDAVKPPRRDREEKRVDGSAENGQLKDTEDDEGASKVCLYMYKYKL